MGRPVHFVAALTLRLYKQPSGHRWLSVRVINDSFGTPNFKLCSTKKHFGLHSSDKTRNAICANGLAVEVLLCKAQNFAARCVLAVSPAVAGRRLMGGTQNLANPARAYGEAFASSLW
jgi:hypothetical protein